jgi:membrane protein YqaA with SNARE-associated domain
MEELLIYLFGSFCALLVLKMFCKKESRESDEKEMEPDLNLVFWAILLSWVAVIIGLIITFYEQDKNDQEEN